MDRIARLSALEILDSRGRPTLRVSCVLDAGGIGGASVPSGASTGRGEALELRDGDPTRHAGLGCLKAVAHVNGEINAALSGETFESQAALDRRLKALDGTDNKSRLGANAILGVSLAFCRAVAAKRKLPLYAHLAQMAGCQPRLPKPMINLYSGGAHAGGQVAIQDAQLVMLKARGIGQTLEIMTEVFRAAAARMAKRYKMRLLRADEGGLAPPFESSREMLAEAVVAIGAAGFAAGDDIALTLDVAASQFYRDGVYQLDGAALKRDEMIDAIVAWRRDFPLISIEDGMDESDWAGWRGLMARLGDRTMILGDDLLCTNPRRIQRAIDEDAANSLLLKVNQIGTLGEALGALNLAREAGWNIVVSARSGETEDDWLADLAVGWAADYIKVGSITQSERLAKYNRLLEIERETGLEL